LEAAIAPSLTRRWSSIPPVEDGVALDDLEDLVEDGKFLEEKVTEWLDREWIPQDVHAEIGRRAASIYVKVGSSRNHDDDEREVDEWYLS